MSETPRADALLTALISGDGSVDGFAMLTDEPEREKALHVLLALLTDPDRRLRVKAIEALGELGDLRASETLRESLDELGILGEFNLKAKALLRLGDRQAILPLLIHPFANYITYLGMMQLDTEELLRSLGKALKSSNEQTLKGAFRCLMMMKKDPVFFPFLVTLLNDEDTRLQAAAVSLLKDIPQAVPFLLPHTLDSDAQVRLRTAQVLGDSADPQTIPALLPLLNDDDPDICTHAAIALGKLGHPEGLALIRTFIATRDHVSAPSHLIDALTALKTLHEPSVPLLIAFAQNPPVHPLIGHVALRVIAEIFAEAGDPAALPVLTKMLEDKHQVLRTAAQQAIEAITARMEGHDE